MIQPRRLPIFPKDKDVFDRLWKTICALVAAAAGLPEDFPSFFRHAVEFGAVCCGSTSRQRLFAEVESMTPVVPDGFTRQDIARLFESAIKYGANKLAEKKTITLDQARAIAESAPAIVRSVAKDLQHLEVDRFTFERMFLDPCLLAARAPGYEYAITSDFRLVFCFEGARKALCEAAGDHTSAAINKVSAERVQQIVRGSLHPLVDAIKQRLLPIKHNPVVLFEESGGVIGVSLQHPVHLGIVPICCRDETQLSGVEAALLTSGQAHIQHGDDLSMEMLNTFSIRPYSLHDSFNRQEDDDGPSVYYAPVSLDAAIGYMADLRNTFNGRRVQCMEVGRELLKGATLTSTDIWLGNSGTRQTIWGLASAQAKRGQSKIMSASGSPRRLSPEYPWYLRQIYWLDDASVPELAMPSDHFLTPNQYVDVTKIIPDGIEDFTRKALEHAKRLLKEQKGNSVIQAIVIELEEQKKTLRKVRTALESETLAKAEARDAGLAAVGAPVLR